MTVPTPPPYPATPAGPLSQPLRGATLQQAVQRFFQKYADFSGRASRSEYWYVVLAFVILNIVLSVLERVAGAFSVLSVIIGVAVIVPNLALGARRLHDTGRSGWWQLLGFIPIIGWIILIVWLATGPKPEGDRFDV